MKEFKYIPDDVKTIIFDWDGTLHESIHIYKPAFLKAYKYLVENGFVSEYKWKDNEISAFLGMNPKQMWNHLYLSYQKM
jgi:phosphoglycolate phosphatase